MISQERFLYISDGQCGFKNRNSSVVIEAKFDRAQNFVDQYAVVGYFNGYYEYGIIDTTGREILKPIYAKIRNFSEGKACALAKYYFITDDMPWWFPFDFGSFFGHSEWRVINEKGVVLFTLDVFDLGEFHHGMAWFKKKIKILSEFRYGFIDSLGNIVIEPQFEYAGNFSNNLAPVRLDGRAGYIDTAGVFTIPAIYQWAGTFSEGLAGVKKDGKYGFIDNRGAIVFDFTYQGVRKFKNERALVRVSIEWKYLYIDVDFMK